MTHNQLTEKLSELNIPQEMADILALFIIFALILTTIAVITYLLRKTLFKRFSGWLSDSPQKWSVPLVDNALPARISWIIPVVLFSLATQTFVTPNTTAYLLAKKITTAGFVIVSVVIINGFFSAINDLHRSLRKNKGSTLRGYTDAARIITTVVGIIFLISIFTGKSPWGIISILGGLTAITMLIFKDTILGFVASVQLTTTDMVRIGDWIEMNQYGADGDVIEISINCIRVQNWDKTVTTIPTYALVSSSFKNWRGMSESGGRRIKRALHINMDSIGFCTDEQLKRFEQFSLISEYIKNRQDEIDTYNRNRSTDSTIAVNGRRQTNVGIFRAYIGAYLRTNPNIHQNMTFLVRQLPPGDTGLPLEIYVFSKDQAWANYEAIQADIFDHLIAAAPEFGLRIYQQPSGYDLRNAGVPAPVNYHP